MTADDRTGSASNLSSSARPPAIGRGDTQTASFDVAHLRLEVTAAPGAARLVVVGADARDIYVVDPATLADWACAIERLLSLTPAANHRERVEYRSPFLMDREGRASVAVEGLVTEIGVSYRLLVHGAESRVMGIMTTAATVRDLANAAVGVVAVARDGPGGAA